MIIHLDLDCFFVSCERTIDPKLLGKPVAVINKSDTAIFSHEPKKAFISTDGGAFAPNLLYDKFGGVDRDWRKHFVDADGKIRGIVVAKSYEAKPYGIKQVRLWAKARSLSSTYCYTSKLSLLSYTLSQA